MGTVLLRGVVLFVDDVYEIWRLRGTDWGSAFAVGAALWTGLWYAMIQ